MTFYVVIKPAKQLYMHLKLSGLISVCIVFSFLLAACSSPKPVATAEIPVIAVESNGEVQEDVIVFLMFNIVKDTTAHSTSITAFQVYESEGTLKEALADSPPADQFLLCILSNEKETEKDTFYLEHPLYRNVEFVNDQMQLDRKLVELESAEFFARIQKQDFSSIQIFEFSNYVKNNDLGSFRF